MKFFISLFLAAALARADAASYGKDWFDSKLYEDITIEAIAVFVMVCMLNQNVHVKTSTVSGNHPDRGDAPETPGGIEI
ncbi:hypothetical protein B9Z55_025583 [Caenorhabditis nigoni]|nr:hypothetical protein B9Z55_025583 [Caenorhabditis nigoni]